MSTIALASPEVATLTVCQKQYKSFSDFLDDIAIAHLSLSNDLLCDAVLKNFESLVQKPVSSESEEIVLYYDRKENGNVIPEKKGFKSYFAENGYEVMENPSLSLLISVMKELTEEKLTELDMPDFVHITLPVDWSSLFGVSNHSGQLFLLVRRYGGERKLEYFSLNSDGDEDEYIILDAIIFRKKKV